VHHARAVEQHIQWAQLFGQALDGSSIGDVQNMFVRALKGVEGAGIDIGGEDFGTGGEVCLDGGLANPLRSGSDQHTFAGKIHGCSVTMSLFL